MVAATSLIRRFLASPQGGAEGVWVATRRGVVPEVEGDINRYMHGAIFAIGTFQAMGAQCFCGCGRRVDRFPLGMRAINTRGAQVSRRLQAMYDSPHTEASGVPEWLALGEEIREALAAAVHKEIDPRSLNEPAVRQWQAAGRDWDRRIATREAAIGREIRRRGYGVEDGARAMLDGEFDEFIRDLD